MGLDGYKHVRNLNVLVVGVPGQEKAADLCDSEHHAVQLLDAESQIRKAELLRKQEAFWNGNDMKSGFDLINPETSWCYNPFAYVRDDKDVLKLINNLIRNTTPKKAQSSDLFWEKVRDCNFLQALVCDLLHEVTGKNRTS